MKRILITTESLNIGGVETALLSLIKELKKYDVEVDLKVLSHGILSKEFEQICNVEEIPIKRAKNLLLNRVLKNIICKSLLKKYKNNKEYDIAIAYYGINNYTDMYAAAANAKEKFIWVHCNFDDLYTLSNHKLIIKIRNKIISKKFSYFDKIIAVSDSSKIGFLKIFKANFEKIEVINNLFDLNKLNCSKEKLDININGNNNMIYIGRLDKLKNVNTLISQFCKVKEEIRDAKLYIVGDGPEKNNLMILSKEQKLEDSIIFLGVQSNPLKYLNKMALCVTASKTETLSMNLIESLAMKKYFVSTDNNGAQDVFYKINKANFNNGIICKENYMYYHIIYYLKNRKTIMPNYNIELYNKKNVEKITNLFHLNN